MRVAMNLYLNGDPSTAPDGVTVAAFLESLGLPRKAVAVDLLVDFVCERGQRKTQA